MSVLTLEYEDIQCWKYRTTKRITIRVLPGLVLKTVRTKFITLTVDGWFVTEAGYAWNGSNVVRDKHSMIASLYHDAAYQLMKLELLSRKHRDYFDKLYAAMCIAEGTWRIDAVTRYEVLKHFAEGSTHLKPGDIPVVQTVSINWGI